MAAAIPQRRSAAGGRDRRATPRHGDEPQLWGEDGFVFFKENLTLGFPRVVATSYMDFPSFSYSCASALTGPPSLTGRGGQP